MEQAFFPPGNVHFNVNFVEAVLDSSIVSRTDRYGNITFVNKNFEAISRYSKEELVGKTHKIVNSGFHPREFWTDMWRTITSGCSWRGEVCNRAKDGSLYWVDTFIYPYRDPNGELTEFFSIRNDISQRKLQKDELSKSGAHLHAILNSTNDIYFLLSPDRKLLNINNAGQKNLTEYWDASASADYEAALLKALNGNPQSWDDFNRALHGEIVEREVELIRLDGERIWHFVRQLAAHDDDNATIGVSIVLTDIHNRKMQELKLRESEMLYRAILNSTNEAYLCISPQMKLLSVNHLGLQLLEQYWNARTYPEIETLFMRLYENQPTARKAIDQALDGEVADFETEIVRPNGTTVWYQVRNLPAYDDAHNIIGVSIVLTNIHDRKLQEARLRESEIRYRSIFNSTNDAFFLISPDIKLLAYNKQGQKFLGGYTDPEETQNAFFRLWGLQEGAEERLQRALKGEVVELEKMSTRIDGSKAWEFVRYLPAYDDNNNIIGASLSITNIEARKSQEALLQESKDHYRAILNSTSDVYFLVSPELKLLAVNSIGDENLTRLVKTWNLPDKQTAFENVFRNQEFSAGYFQRALAGEVVEVEHEVKRYDGTRVWYHHRYLPVFNDAKESIGVSISMTNIHTRKMQEIEIEAKNQALTKIAWSQSHEMRRPVASILGLMQLKQAPEPMISDEEFMEHLRTMVSELDLCIRKNVERTYMASK